MNEFPGQTVKDYQGILFGFELIPGLPVSYEFWCFLLNSLINSRDVADANVAVPNLLEWLASDPDMSNSSVIQWWRKTRDVSPVLRRWRHLKQVGGLLSCAAV